MSTDANFDQEFAKRSSNAWSFNVGRLAKFGMPWSLKCTKTNWFCFAHSQIETIGDNSITHMPVWKNPDYKNEDGRN